METRRKAIITEYKSATEVKESYKGTVTHCLDRNGFLVCCGEKEDGTLFTVYAQFYGHPQVLFLEPAHESTRKPSAYPRVEITLRDVSTILKDRIIITGDLINSNLLPDGTFQAAVKKDDGYLQVFTITGDGTSLRFL